MPLVETPGLVLTSLAGRYVVERELGRGGMGVVLLARDEKLGRKVALKVLSRTASADALQRFEQEARAAGALNHPNVIAVYDSGLASGQPFIVSELLEGGTLRERLGGKPLGVRQALDYAVQLARGLAAAHDRGIVHRDLKPENLFITNEGRLKILDFGIAKLPAAEEARRTRDGAVIGTVGYMSPEQVRGETADARADIFSFGAILYEMLAGKPAFERRTAVESGYAIVNATPDDLPEHVPAEVERVVRRCLEKKPEQRYQTAHELALEVQASSGTTDSRAPLLARTRRRMVLAMAVSALIGAAAGAVVWSGIGARPRAAFHQLTFARGRVLYARFVPGGAPSAVYTAWWGGVRPDIYISTADMLEPRSLNLPGPNLLAVSKTGELLIQERPRFALGGDYGTLARVPLQGGSPREIAENVLAADWAPDGATIAVARLIGGRTHVEFPVGHEIAVRPYSAERLRVSPDGRHVAVASGEECVEILDAHGTPRVARTKWITGIAWNSADELWAGEFEGGGTTLYGISTKGAVRTITALPGYAELQDISGGRALISMEDTRLEISASVDGAKEAKQLAPFATSYLIDLAADGSAVLFGERYGDTFLRRTDGSPATHLTSWAALSLSSDAQKVLALNDGGLWEVPVGPGAPVRLPPDGLEVVEARYFPNGRRLLVTGRQPGQGRRLFVRDRTGTTARAISPEGIQKGWVAISPEEKLVAAVEADFQTRLYPVDGGDARPVPGLPPGFVPGAFSADGRSLTVFAIDGIPARVLRVDLATGKAEELAPLLSENAIGVRGIWKLLVTPDGRTRAYAYRRSQSSLLIADGLR